MKVAAKKLANYLKARRLEVGLSQKEVAQLLGYTSPQFVSNWERGLASPPLEVLNDLIRIYRLDREYIINVMLEITRRKLEKKLKPQKKIL